MTKTLYISDLDGTLLNSSSRVSPETAKLISGLGKRGAMITVATARTAATADPLLKDCDIRIPAVVTTGAALWDFDRRRYIDPVFIDGEEYRRIIALFRSEGYMSFVYELQPDGMMRVFHTPQLNAAEQLFYEQRKDLHLKHFQLNGVPADADRVMLIFGTGPRQMIERIAARLREDCDCSVSCYPDIFNPEVALIELFAPGVNKAAAIRRLAAQTGADRVVVFGDNLNDLPMMREADLSVAVANALPEVRAEAKLVIGGNDDNAVARFIEYDFEKA
ncbi:MAG: Cof-type HAD-IIB family hydrolase [Muribaculaceae bacterium]|nr:Cof-type HAD-IIB family hydrolase [Muribaculaceae bacterium]